MMVLKQIFSFILPITVLVIVPLWIEKEWAIHIGIRFFGGVALAVLGLAAMVSTISSFISLGKGTLAPWSPTKKLVITGLYRYVRNPMILGVITVLCGEAVMFRSKSILTWAAVFFVLNSIYFLVYEEPDLERKFGDDYRQYKKQVGRWIPRVHPYRPERTKKP